MSDGSYLLRNKVAAVTFINNLFTASTEYFWLSIVTFKPPISWCVKSLNRQNDYRELELGILLILSVFIGSPFSRVFS